MSYDERARPDGQDTRDAGRQTVTTLPARLDRLGRLRWTQIRQDLRDAEATCAWSALNGFHLKDAMALPDIVIGATHLWAWTTGAGGTTAWRVRLDHGDALTARLDLDPGGAGSEGDPVTVRVRPGMPWGSDDQQITRQAEAVHAFKFDLLELPGRQPVAFVREAPHS